MLTTRAVAKRLGIPEKTLSRYVIIKKVPTPEVVRYGPSRGHSWTEEGIEQVRKLLPQIAEGRKTHRERMREAATNRQSAKSNPMARKKAQKANKQPKPKKKH